MQLGIKEVLSCFLNRPVGLSLVDLMPTVSLFQAFGIATSHRKLCRRRQVLFSERRVLVCPPRAVRHGSEIHVHVGWGHWGLTADYMMDEEVLFELDP